MKKIWFVTLLLSLLLTSLLAKDVGESGENSAGGEGAWERFQRLQGVAEEDVEHPGAGHMVRPASDMGGRKKHDAISQGAVYQPKAASGGPVSVTIGDLELGVAAKIYADLKQKEVMVSSMVSSKLLSFKALNVSREEALRIFEEELRTVGVAIVELEAGITVLCATHVGK